MKTYENKEEMIKAMLDMDAHLCDLVVSHAEITGIEVLNKDE